MIESSLLQADQGKMFGFGRFESLAQAHHDLPTQSSVQRRRVGLSSWILTVDIDSSGFRSPSLYEAVQQG